VWPATVPAGAAIGGAPDSGGRGAGPPARGSEGMGTQRRDAARALERAGALPAGQFGIPRGAPFPEIFQVTGVSVVKRLAGALREPGAVPLKCGEFVVHHCISLGGMDVRAALGLAG